MISFILTICHLLTSFLIVLFILGIPLYDCIGLIFGLVYNSDVQRNVPNDMQTSKIRVSSSFWYLFFKLSQIIYLVA